MQLRYYQLWLLILFVIIGCNDVRRRSTSELMNGLPGRAQTGPIIPIGKIQLKDPSSGNPIQTTVSKMKMVGSNLIISGKPFGLSAWDMGSNPISPAFLFSYADNIRNFSNIPGWVPDLYASGGITSLSSSAGLFLLTSGMAGSSLINASNLRQLMEVNRFPPRDLSQPQVPQDPLFTYDALITDPNQQYFYGFRQQDFAVSLRFAGNSVQPVSALRYSSNGNKGTCCVSGAATFQGKAFVGFRSSVRQFSFGSNGQLRQDGIYNDINGTNIVATQSYIYVQHQAIPGNTYPSGIYVFDTQMNVVVLLPILPIAFEVSPDDQYLYANLDNDSVEIYQQKWLGMQ